MKKTKKLSKKYLEENRTINVENNFKIIYLLKLK